MRCSQEIRRKFCCCRGTSVFNSLFPSNRFFSLYSDNQLSLVMTLTPSFSNLSLLWTGDTFDQKSLNFVKSNLIEILNTNYASISVTSVVEVKQHHNYLIVRLITYSFAFWWESSLSLSVGRADNSVNCVIVSHSIASILKILARPLIKSITHLSLRTRNGNM